MRLSFLCRPAFTRICPAVFLTLLVTALLLAGCAPASTAVVTPPSQAVSPSPVPSKAPSRTPVLPTTTPTPTVSPSPQPSATDAPELTFWADPAVPRQMLNSLHLPGPVRAASRRANASLYLEVARSPGAETAAQAYWTLALAAPFPTITDEVSRSDLMEAWQGRAPDGFTGAPLLLSLETLDLLAAWWGPPAPGAARVVEPSLLLDTAWKTSAWAILPFEEIEPRWKVLRAGGISPLDRDFDPGAYSLSVPVRVSGLPEALRALRDLAGDELTLQANRDPDKLSVLVMTGVTALSRNTAVTMEREGVLFPGRDIRHWLAGADLTHISNEVSFAEDCPAGRPDRRFCSPSHYIDLLEDVGVDIVELTGNHNLDWGADAYLHTLELYRGLGWHFFGGGATLEDARRPLVLEHNGNRLAFLGCNAAGPEGALAGPDRPGAAPCDIDALEKEIQGLAAQGVLTIMTFQHVETDNYRPELGQRMPEFRRMAQAGAVIVSGSQSHFPQTMTFVGSNFVHYGLGNLFFDQMGQLATRREFIDRHVFYDGRYLGVELLTAMLEDYARPRPMTPKERADLLALIFDLSIWSHP